MKSPIGERVKSEDTVTESIGDGGDDENDVPRANHLTNTSGEGDRINNGALDNASGISALLEIARGFKQIQPQPKRSILFLFVTAEEQGLLGSEYFAQNPPMPIGAFAANLNVDSMNVYGPSSTFVLLGADRTDAFGLVQELARAQGRTPGVDAHPERGYFFRSDHFPFAKAGVPAFSLTLGDPSGFRGPRAEQAREMSAAYNATHYHQPSDEVERIDFEHLTRVADLVARAARVLAEGPRPAWKPGGRPAPSTP